MVRLPAPDGITLDAAGNLYIAEPGDSLNNRIRKVSNGVITTIAGNGVPAYYGDNGPAVNAALWGPLGVAADALGRIFVADSGNNRIRVPIPYCAYNISPSSIQSAISVLLLANRRIADLDHSGDPAPKRRNRHRRTDGCRQPWHGPRRQHGCSRSTNRGDPGSSGRI